MPDANSTQPIERPEIPDYEIESPEQSLRTPAAAKAAEELMAEIEGDDVEFLGQFHKNIQSLRDSVGELRLMVKTGFFEQADLDKLYGKFGAALEQLDKLTKTSPELHKTYQLDDLFKLTKLMRKNLLVENVKGSPGSITAIADAIESALQKIKE